MIISRDPKAKARDLLDRSNAIALPVSLDQAAVNLNKVANLLNVQILYEDFEDNISGLLVVKNGKHAIGVNKRHHSNRQRFTIAHEIGHLVLHHNDPKKNDIYIDKKWTYFRATEKGQRVDEQEKEANQFAAELLMPDRLVKQLIEKLGLTFADENDIPMLAGLLKVSEQALTIRLIDLKHIEPY